MPCPATGGIDATSGQIPVRSRSLYVVLRGENTNERVARLKI